MALAIRDRIKELRRVPANTLRPHPKNWRRHPQAQVDALLGALGEIGFAGVILAREDDDGALMILDGHARQELAGSEIVPVVVTDLTEAESEKLLATYDPIGAMAEADIQTLRALTETMTFADASLAAVVAAVVAQEVAPKVGLTDPDAVPPLPPEPETQPGDLWVLGPHRLLCGDATVEADVAKLLDGARPALTITDPPYGVNYEGGAGNVKKRERQEGDETADLYLGAVPLVQSDVLYLWHGGTKAELVYRAVRESGFDVRAQIVWSKLSPHFGGFTAHYKQAHEPLLYCVRGETHWQGPTTERTIWEYPQPSINDLHPTQKPLECMERPIRNHEGDVYDPFVGSGTTIIAAERQGRRCYAMEIEPRYVDVAVKRWEEYTGRKAERASSEAETS